MQEILKLLENIQRIGYNSYQVFDDWLDLMLTSLIGQEEKYLETVRKYDNDRFEHGNRPIDHFATAFGALMTAMERANEDLLGDIYTHWNINNKYAGQYFTPVNICKLIAEMLKPENDLISDPCCGSGRMLVESCKIMETEHLDKAVFYGQDIDFTCVKMCALNLMFFNLNGYVILGNTLTFEYKRVFQTGRSAMGGVIRELSIDEIDLIKPHLESRSVHHSGKQFSFF